MSATIQQPNVADAGHMLTDFAGLSLALDVLFEGTPAHIELPEVEGQFLAVPRVQGGT